ncbi:unnamed protein product [Arctogadus glacialis]
MRLMKAKQAPSHLLTFPRSNAQKSSSKTCPAAEIQSTYRAVLPLPFVHCPRKETAPWGGPRPGFVSGRRPWRP